MSSAALVPRSADTQVQLRAVLPGRHLGEGPMTGNRADENLRTCREVAYLFRG
jgi:hypothetical protein